MIFNKFLGEYDIDKKIYDNMQHLVKTEEQLKEFAVDCDEICELRGWIYEWHNNSAKDFEEARKDHYEVVVPYIESVLKKCCNKYGFFMHTD